MNLFEDIDREAELGKRLSRYSADNNYRLIEKGSKWILFDKDELKVEIKLIEHKDKKKIEFRSPLLVEVGCSIETIIRPICGMKYIRDIAGRDLIGKSYDKIILLRYINHNENLYYKNKLANNLNSVIKKSKKLSEEISSLLHYNMTIKLN